MAEAGTFENLHMEMHGLLAKTILACSMKLREGLKRA